MCVMCVCVWPSLLRRFTWCLNQVACPSLSQSSTKHRVGIAYRHAGPSRLPAGLAVPYTLLICPRHYLTFQSAKGLAKTAVVLPKFAQKRIPECNGLLWRASCSLRDGSTWRLNHVTHANLGIQESASSGHLKQRRFQFKGSLKRIDIQKDEEASH